MIITGASNKSLNEKMNLSPEGKKLKNAIKAIVVDDDDELRKYVSDIVEEVIEERR